MNLLSFINTLDFDADKINKKTLKVTEDNDKEFVYHVLNYSSCEDQNYDETLEDLKNGKTPLGYYRSVVVDPETNQVLCIAPPKSCSLDSFTQKYPEITSAIQVNETIEGTMINLFWDPRRNTWEIATKGSIGGNYWYFRTSYDKNSSQQTFRQMFCNALGYPSYTKFDEISIFNDLSKNCCYSFVLQHPSNHIVLEITEPSIWLIGVYEINDKNEVMSLSLETISKKPLFNNVTNRIIVNTYSKPLEEGEVTSIAYFNDTIENNNQSQNIKPGFMLTDLNTGLRLKIMNKRYEEIKSIRGNNPNMQFHYFALQQAEQVQTFLEHFPKYKGMFDKFEKQTNEFIRKVHDAYVLYYVQKRGKEFQIHKSIFNHICKLHFEIRVPSLEKAEKVTITKQVVSDYFKQMQPKEKLYYITKAFELEQ